MWWRASMRETGSSGFWLRRGSTFLQQRSLARGLSGCNVSRAGSFCAQVSMSELTCDAIRDHDARREAI
jgi:hypothetical protein